MDARAALLIGAAVALTVYRPAIGLAVFLTAGAFKDASFLSGLPFYMDITLLSALTIAILIVKEWRPASSPAKAALPGAYLWLIFFCLLMVVSLLYTPNPAGGLDKTARFLAFSVFAAAAPVFLLKTPSSRRDFLLTLLTVGALTAIAGLVGWSADPTDFTGALGANHITLGRFSGMTVIVGLAMAAVGSSKYERAFGFSAATVAVAALVISSARGPLLALIIALPATLFFLRSGSRSLRTKIVLASGALPLATWAIIALGWLPPVFSRRLLHVFALLSGGSADGSVTNRLALAWRGLRAIASSPVLGLGVGGFPSVAWDLPANHYPHNIFIETAAELGLPALFALAAFIILAVIRLRRSALRVGSQEERFIAFSAGSLLVFWLINAMLSGDLNDNRLLLATIGLIFAQASGITFHRQVPAQDQPIGGAL